MAKLTILKVRTAKPGIHGDGQGLYLRVSPEGAKAWVLRVQSDGRRRDIGLGSVEKETRSGNQIAETIPLLHRRILSLAEARDKASVLRKFAKAGLDPKEERDRDREPIFIPTFRQAIEQAHAELSPGWSTKHSAAFLSSLTNNIPAKLGDKPVDQLGTDDITLALSPIWIAKPQMARKVRVWIVQVLDFAKSKKWRTDATPTAKEITKGLPKQPDGGNFEAMPYADAAAFVSDQLDKEPSAGRLALLFTIFTAARSGEVRSARWEHIDIEGRAWNRPAELMKGKVKHTVTLNDAALSILRRAEAMFGSKGLVFPGSKKDAPLSDMTLSKALRAAGRSETVHGFRSTFRDWAAENMPAIPDPVAEAALAHAVPDKVVAAYKRTRFIEMRRTLLEAWGRHVAPGLSSMTADVVDTTQII